MRLPLQASDDARDHTEPAPSLLIPLVCLLAILVALIIVATQMNTRVALIAAAFAAVSLATRLPRILPITAALCLIVAGFTLALDPTSASFVTAHAMTHLTHRR